MISPLDLDYQVAGPHGAQPVRDQYDGIASPQPQYRCEQFLLGQAVERAGCLIQDENRGFPVQGAGDADSLSLAAAETHAAFTDEMIEAVREAKR